MELTPLQIQGIIRFSIFSLEVLVATGVIFWIRSRQRGKQDTSRHLLNLVLWGGLTALIAAIVEMRYSIDTDRIIEINPQLAANYGSYYDMANFAIVSLIEELAKYTVGVFIILSSKNYHRLSDSISYMILIGIGFAIIEDVFYLLDPNTIAPLRLLSFFIHAGTASIIGFAMGQFRYQLSGYRNLLKAIIWAVTLHFGYNISSSLPNTTAAFWLSLLITIYISLQVFIMFRKSLVEEYVFEKKNSPKKLPTHLLHL